MVEYITGISLRSYELTKQTFADAFERVDSHINNHCPKLTDDDALNVFLDDAESP